MSTGLAERPKPTEKLVAYKPLGSHVQVELSISLVRQFLCTPTRSGQLPSDAEMIKFMMLCKARELDPWVGDAFLVGYDSKDGPKFSLITSIQAMFKRAEMSPAYNGFEQGVIVRTSQGVEYRPGDIVFEDEQLLGGWARCYRKDREHPDYDALKLGTYSKPYGVWGNDPAGMIVKCASASVLRQAFPTQLGGLYTADELSEMSEQRVGERTAGPQAGKMVQRDEGLMKLIDAGAGSPAPKPTTNAEPSGPTGGAQEPPVSQGSPEGSPADNDDSGAPDPWDEIRDEFARLTSEKAIIELQLEKSKNMEPAAVGKLNQIVEEHLARVKKAKAGRGERSNRKQDEMFDKGSPSAQEAGH